MTRALLKETASSLKVLLSEAQRAASELENEFPRHVHFQKWMAAKHSPVPWEIVYQRARAEDTPVELVLTLAVRSALAEVIEKLNWCLVKIEAEAQPIGSLKLATVKRVELP